MLTPNDLRCEYAANPLGIGTSRPRLGWKLDHPERGQVQTAYQIIAAPTSEQVDDTIGALPCESSHEQPACPANGVWDSGKVSSANSVAVTYDGSPLGSRTRVFWRVRCWDAQDRPGPWSEVAWFETALLTTEDWQASWIGYPANWAGRALYFRKVFSVDKPVQRARLYVSGLGYSEAYINGIRLGDAVLDPAYTDTSKRIMYRTFDIGDALQPGENVYAAILGNGWLGQPRLLAQIEILYQDGTLACHATGPTGGWSVFPGPIGANSVYGGEVYDAREEDPTWYLPQTTREPTPADRRKQGIPVHVPSPGGVLTAQVLEPIQRMREIEVKAIAAPQPGVYVVDLGQNIAGWARLRVRGPRGHKITLRYAEVTYPDGTVNQENLLAAAAKDVYILKGEGEEVWEPRFTYHGFRYVQVEGYPGTMPEDAVTGIVVRSAVADAGEFVCSNDLLNRIQTMARWTEQDNLHGIPTDCPQRHERMGWLNDMSARAEEALYNYDVERLLAKWIADIRDAQDPAIGAIPGTAPWGFSPRPADPVCVSYLETAWLLYAYYGDRRTLAEHYDGFKRWLQCLSDMAIDGVLGFSLWGDWAPPLASAVPGTPRNASAPGEVISTGYYYYTAHLLARIAGILGEGEDQEGYASLAERIANVFSARFWDEKMGGYSTNSQSCNAFALWLGIVPADRQDRVVDNLVQDVLVLHDGHLTTGNVGTKYLLESLSAHGRADVALTLATQTTYPSWGYMLANGATTLWERWELATGPGMNSHNHPMLGSVSSWFYKVLAGLNVLPETVGADRLVIHPHFVAGLDFASATYHSVRGDVGSAWQRRDSSIALTVQIPVNASAHVVIALDADTHRITEGGVLLWQRTGASRDVRGIRLLSADASRVTLRVGSGRYDFRID